LRIESLPVRAGSGAHQAGTPNRDNASCHAFDWPSLRHENCRITANDEAKIEDRRGERVAVPNSQAEISPKSEESLRSLDKSLSME
jgi:hypothetical protein